LKQFVVSITFRRLHVRHCGNHYFLGGMKIKILCTLGPASLDGDVLARLDEQGVDVFRINLSHTPAEEIDAAIATVRAASSTPICLDTEGAQVRCGAMAPDVCLSVADEVTLTAEPVTGNARELTLWPDPIFRALEPGMTMSIDFDGARVRVTDVAAGRATGVVVAPGLVRSNKAVTVDSPVELPALSDKDVAAIAIGARRGVTHYALSFAAGAADVSRLRALAPPGAFIIAKIESRTGVRNMDGIIHAADAVLIDRGDLSREVPIEHVPYYQKAIVRRANRWNRCVYVATNLLESMIVNRQPTIAEANDIANTLLDGVHGLVLAAETAIGTDPVRPVEFVRQTIRAFERASYSELLDGDRPDAFVPPADVAVGQAA
jgi:pyruvate kinase